MSKRIAYSYVRFSTKKQEHGASLQRQTKLAVAYAAENDLQLDESTTLHDLGFSGWTGENVTHGALGGFLAAAKTGKIITGSVLLIENLDRLSRLQALDALDVLRDIVNAGVDVVTLTDNRIWTAQTIQNLPELMWSLMVFARANDESNRKSRLIRDGFDKKRAAKLPQLFGSGPGWLIARPDRSGWDVDVARADSVRWAFERAASGLGCKAIAIEGNRTARVAPGRTGRWNESGVSDLLRAREAIGIYRVGMRPPGKKRCVKTGEELPDYYPTVVPPDLFYRVQAAIDARAQAPRRRDAAYRNVLQGILRCGLCGGAMTRRYSRPPSATGACNSTYVCRSRMGGLGCTCKTVPARALETVLLPRLYALIASHVVDGTAAAAAIARQDALEAELVAVRLNVQRITDLLLGEDAPPRALLQRLRDAEYREQKLEAELVAVRIEAVSHAEITIPAITVAADRILALIDEESEAARIARAEEHTKIARAVNSIYLWPDAWTSVVWRDSPSLVSWVSLVPVGMTETGRINRDVTHPVQPDLPAHYYEYLAKKMAGT